MFKYIELKKKDLAYKLESLPVFFNDLSCLDIISKVINEEGVFIQYPGLIEDEVWLKEKRVRLIQDVHYEAQFFKLKEDGYLMLWLVQPDGRYWMDDFGFGIEEDKSVVFYSLLDEKGTFLKPFELYAVDYKTVIHDYDEYLGWGWN